MATERASDTTFDKPLSEKHRQILKKVGQYLVNDMNPEEVLHKMAADEVFLQSDEEKIKGKLTRSEKCWELLEILPRSGAKAYQIFKEAFQVVHPHLANIILEQENMRLGSDENSEQADETRKAPDSTENKKLSKKVVTLQRCMSIQDDAGNCWKELGAELQIPEGELRNIEKNHRLARDRGFDVLQSWRDREGSDATVGCLCDALESIGQRRIAEKFLAKG